MVLTECLFQTEEIVEEIAATFDDDNFDSVNGMKDVQLEISAIESISKRSGVDEESSVQSTASSKAAKKPRGRGRATKKSEESSMISKKILHIYLTITQVFGMVVFLSICDGRTNDRFQKQYLMYVTTSLKLMVLKAKV